MGSPGPGDCSGEKGRLKDLAKATMPLLTKLVLLPTSCWTLGAAHPLRGKDLRRATQSRTEGPEAWVSAQCGFKQIP